MRSIKFLAIALVLGLTGTVYAAGSTPDATHTHATATGKPGCCKIHMAGDKKSGASAQETCNTKDGGCCKERYEHGAWRGMALSGSRPVPVEKESVPVHEVGVADSASDGLV